MCVCVSVSSAQRKTGTCISLASSAHFQDGVLSSPSSKLITASPLSPAPAEYRRLPHPSSGPSSGPSLLPLLSAPVTLFPLSKLVTVTLCLGCSSAQAEYRLARGPSYRRPPLEALALSKLKQRVPKVNTWPSLHTTPKQTVCVGRQ